MANIICPTCKQPVDLANTGRIVFYNRAATLRDFALSVELLRESNLSPTDLEQLAEFEQRAIAGISACPEGLPLGDIRCEGDPRRFVRAAQQHVKTANPSNMDGRLRLTERELIGLLHHHKHSGSASWQQDYLRQCEQQGAARDPARIAHWNSRHPNHSVQ